MAEDAHAAGAVALVIANDDEENPDAVVDDGDAVSLLAAPRVAAVVW